MIKMRDILEKRIYGRERTIIPPVQFHSLNLLMKNRENKCNNQLLISTLMDQGCFIFTLFLFLELIMLMSCCINHLNELQSGGYLCVLCRCACMCTAHKHDAQRQMANSMNSNITLQ